MRRILKLAATCAAFFVVGGEGVSTGLAEGSRPCAFVNQINNFTAIDDHTAIIETSPWKRYKVTFFNTCRELKWAWSIRIDARPGICLSPGDTLIVGRDGIPERCVIQTIEALPPKP